MTANDRGGLRQQAAGAVRWTASGTALNAALSFVQTAVLAHFLAPSDFGLGSMIAVVVAFAQMFADAGVSSAIIYRQTPTRDELSSLYWFNLMTGALIFVLVNAAVPLAVALFNEPELAGPLRLASVVFLIAPIGQQFQFLLQKDLQFRPLTISGTSGYFAGLVVAVAAGVAGAGVYALVFGQLANAVVRTGLLVQAQWDMRPRLHFAPSEIRSYLAFGLYQMGDKVANFFNAYLLHGLIGSMLGAHVLGLYTLAFELAFKPLDAITPIVTRVAFPVLAKVRDDIDRVRRGYLSMLRLLSAVNFPIALGIAALAPILVPAIYGDVWRESILLVEVLAVVALLRSSGSPIGALLLGLGRAGWGFSWSAGKMLLQVPALYMGIVLGGAAGAAIAYLAIQVIFSTAAYLLLIKNLLGPCLSAYVRAFAPALGLAITVAIAVRVVGLLLEDTALLGQLLASLITAVIAYLCLAMVFARPLIIETLQLVRNRK